MNNTHKIKPNYPAVGKYFSGVYTIEMQIAEPEVWWEPDYQINNEIDFYLSKIDTILTTYPQLKNHRDDLCLIALSVKHIYNDEYFKAYDVGNHMRRFYDKFSEFVSYYELGNGLERREYCTIKICSGKNASRQKHFADFEVSQIYTDGIIQFIKEKLKDFNASIPWTHSSGATVIRRDIQTDFYEYLQELRLETNLTADECFNFIVDFIDGTDLYKTIGCVTPDSVKKTVQRSLRDKSV